MSVSKLYQTAVMMIFFIIFSSFLVFQPRAVAETKQPTAVETQLAFSTELEKVDMKEQTTDQDRNKSKD